ncbi:MAG: ankyrin repeat domain-containing protein [Parachlamydia sp.]|nr:ankyrin repeat domain-containing protein [Parachlamydia sp.]
MKYIKIILISIYVITGCASINTAPLAKAITKGDLQTMQSLVKSGANINEPISNFTPLQWSVEEGKEDAVNFLLQNGADINASNGGQTPLMLACIRGDLAIVKLLLSNGADLSLKDKSGSTAFSYARYNLNYNIAKLLNLAAEAEERGGKRAVAKVCSDFKEDPSIRTAQFESYIDYNNITLKITYEGNKGVSVIVNDKRPYVLSGQTRPEWVGITRGGFGRAYDLGTSTLNPLADEFSRFITNGLVAAGFKKNELSSADKVISIDVLEWLSVTGGGVLSLTFGTDLHYKILIRVSDEKNKVLVQKEFQGKESLGGNLSQVYELLPRATGEIYNAILNSSPIRTALLE